MSWPGRVAFRTLPNGKNVFVGGGHNQGSAQTPTDLVATLLPGLSTTDDTFDVTSTRTIPLSVQSTPRCIRSTLQPSLLSRSYHNARVDVAAPKFSPPEDMPWVKATEIMIYPMRWID